MYFVKLLPTRVIEYLSGDLVVVFLIGSMYADVTIVSNMGIMQKFKELYSVIIQQFVVRVPVPTKHLNVQMEVT